MNQNILQSINAVEGFDPVEYAVDYTDLNSGETRKRLPVMIQMAWFRLRYPEGKISIEVMPGHECFVAKARIYPNYQNPPENFLAEATAARTNLLSLPGNGHRRQPSASRSAMPVSVCSLPWPVRTSAALLLMSLRLIWSRPLIPPQLLRLRRLLLPLRLPQQSMPNHRRRICSQQP